MSCCVFYRIVDPTRPRAHPADHDVESALEVAVAEVATRSGIAEHSSPRTPRRGRHAAPTPVAGYATGWQRAPHFQQHCVVRCSSTASSPPNAIAARRRHSDRGAGFVPLMVDEHCASPYRLRVTGPSALISPKNASSACGLRTYVPNRPRAHRSLVFSSHSASRTSAKRLMCSRPQLTRPTQGCLIQPPSRSTVAWKVRRRMIALLCVCRGSAATIFAHATCLSLEGNHRLPERLGSTRAQQHTAAYSCAGACACCGVSAHVRFWVFRISWPHRCAEAGATPSRLRLRRGPIPTPALFAPTQHMASTHDHQQCGADLRLKLEFFRNVAEASAQLTCADVRVT